MTAYELADELSWNELDTDEIETWTKEAVFMLRQQADRIAELEKVIQDGIKVFGEIQNQRLKDKFETPQTKPLSDEEIIEIADNLQESSQPYNINFARAIEERHGIK